MKSETNPRGSGRKVIKLDYVKLDNLIAIQCTLSECACVMNVSTDTIQRRLKEDKKVDFATYFNLKRGKGKASLRRRQFQMAERNPTMAIWLGKQYLDQKDKQEITDKDSEIKTIRIEFINGKDRDTGSKGD